MRVSLTPFAQGKAKSEELKIGEECTVVAIFWRTKRSFVHCPPVHEISTFETSGIDLLHTLKLLDLTA